jgi:hypothetical protein
MPLLDSSRDSGGSLCFKGSHGRIIKSKDSAWISLVGETKLMNWIYKSWR